MPIVTLTPNPSLDLLFSADRLVWDDANRVPMPRRRPGGQGINVVRAVRALDPAARALAVAPLGGPVGDELRDTLAAEGTPLRAVPIEGETRLFVGARERQTGRSLLLNPRGPTADDELGDRLVRAVEAAIRSVMGERGNGASGGPGGSSGSGDADRADESLGGWVACCGSLLPGLPADLYADVGRVARDHGLRFVADCDGEPLAAAAGVADLLVPNEMEASRLVGRPVDGPEEAAEAGRTLLGLLGRTPPGRRPAGPEPGDGRVVITLGARGAVSVDADGGWWAFLEPPPELSAAMETGSAVGAGDAFLAALLCDPASGGPDALVRGVATGSAVLLSEGSDLVRREDVERVLPHVRVREMA